MTDRFALPPARLPVAALFLLVAAAIVAACGSRAPTPPPGAVPVTFIYSIVGPAAGATHTTHFQLLDAQNKLLTETLMQPAGNVDTVTISLPPGIYSAISWDEEPASPDPAISRKCGSVFTVDPNLALVVTISSSRAGACLTDTAEPGASEAPGATDSPSPTIGNPEPS